MDDETVRQALHASLDTAFPDLEKYYQPPGDLLIARPCIVYERKALDPSFANNLVYSVGMRFQITILSDLPGYASNRNVYDIPGLIILDNRSFVTADVVHDVFTVSVNAIT